MRALARRVRSILRRAHVAARFAGQPITVDPTAHVSRRSTIRVCGGGSIVIGAHCEIHDYAMILTYGGDIVLGDHTSVNPFTIIYGHGGTKIGTDVRIAAHCVIIPANHVPASDDKPLFESGVTAHGITIEGDVWIGAGCQILDGVTIGRGATVGAGSVVTRSIAPHSTVAGVPARVLGTHVAR
jgi:acetyltransferase-like isoleucine patch superfamily enzyme